MTNDRGSERRDTASRLITASPDTLYQAFEDASSLMAWLPPAGMTGRVLEYDFREGGRYRIELTYQDKISAGSGKTTELTDVTEGQFVQLIPGRRITQAVSFQSSDPALAGTMTVTWSFEPAPQGTTVTVTAANVPSGISKTDHDAGLTSSLEHLAAFVQ